VFAEELVLVTPRSDPRIRTARDIGNRTVIAFATGCSYRRRLEAWLGRASVVPERVMEFDSYHAIVACVAAGSGIAIVPRTVIRLVRAERDVAIHRLPPDIARSRTHLVWRNGHHSVALAALQREFRRGTK
jgi:DNA-binding transcriptional LysR family regulator